MSKKEEDAELEGLIAEDGSHPVDKGLMRVEYNTRNFGALLHADMAPWCFKVNIERTTDTIQESIIRDKKSVNAAVLDKKEKKSAVSKTSGKKGGRKK